MFQPILIVEKPKVDKKGIEIPMIPQLYDSVPHARCPRCKNAILVYCDDLAYPYCRYCGQAIDWEAIK